MIANVRWSHLIRFIVIGGLNTGITYVVYLALNGWMVPWLAYGAAYSLGIMIAFIGNRIWVFNSKKSWMALVPYAAMQLVLMAIGSFISWLATDALPVWAIGLAAIAAVLPISFLANAYFFRQTSFPQCSP